MRERWLHNELSSLKELGSLRTDSSRSIRYTFMEGKKIELHA